MTTADEESEVQENVVSTLNWKNSDLCSLSGMVKHVQRNMSRGMEKYIASLFCYCYQLWLFQPPHSASITIKAATNVSDSE